MAISFVQINKNDFTVSSATFALSFSSGTTAGSIIVVAGSFDNTTTGVTLSNGHSDTVTDSGKGLVNDTVSNIRTFVKAFFTPTTGTTTITATYSGTNPTFGDLFIWEIAGLTSAAFDKVAEANATGGTSSSGSTGTLSSSAEAAIAFGATGGAFSVKGASWTTGQGSTVGTNAGDGITTHTTSLGEHQVVSATTALTGDGTLTSSVDYTMWCATFNSAAAALNPVGASMYWI